VLKCLTQLFVAPATASPKPAKRPRLTVETLEDRAVHASFTAATVADLIADMHAANQTPEADTITLVPGATYTLTDDYAPNTAGGNFTNGRTGTPNVTGTLTVIGNGATIERGTSDLRLLHVAVGGALTLQNLTLQGGLARWEGGAVRNLGTLTMTGVTVQNNTAGFSDSASGGGVYSAGSLTMTGCTVLNNRAVGGGGGNAYLDWGGVRPGSAGGEARGGGVCVGDAYDLASGVIVRPTATTITGCSIRGNTAQGGDGGQAYSNMKNGGNGGAGYGGGLYAAGGSLIIETTTVTANSALGGAAGGKGGTRGGGYGGGLYLAPMSSVYLDGDTEDHVKRNKALTANSDIYGAYTVI
jgi:hypothetical protein